MSYLRVRVRPDAPARAFTVILRDPVERNGLLTGIEVDRLGEEIAPAGVDERRHVIDAELVARRTPLRMHPLYGELVDACEEAR